MIAHFKSYSILILFAVFYQACTQESPEIHHGFYHWKTALHISEAENNYLEKLNTQKLYVKFFDVDWLENRAIPMASLQIISPPSPKLSIIPTVFITNRTLLNLKEEEIKSLAQNIGSKIFKIANTHNLSFSEIQIDCDWNASTKSKYFSLLETLNENLKLKAKIIVSATIRLHQVKYFKKTGVPPVDRGMLMYYNVGKVQDWETTNSILSTAEARKYLSNFQQYPLPLDLALPIFSWGVLFRNGRMIKLINTIKTEHLENHENFKSIGPNRYQVIKSGYFYSHYLYKNDWIRVETISPELLEENARYLAPVFQKNDFTLTFYHLDTTTIKHFPYENLETVSQILQH